MTRPRLYGDEGSISKWLRAHKLLDSKEQSLIINDIDLMLHKYRTPVDRIGTREVHLKMNVEFKTRSALPNKSQLQSLFFEHQQLIYEKNKNNLLQFKKLLDIDGTYKSVWHFGWFVISMPGLSPGWRESDLVSLYRFDDNGRLIGTPITVITLLQILRFEVRPDTLMPISLRRHHKNEIIEEEEITPLGLVIKRQRIRRS